MVNTDTEGATENVRSNKMSILSELVEFRENVKGFFPQGESKLSIITRFP